MAEKSSSVDSDLSSLCCTRRRWESPRKERCRKLCIKFLIAKNSSLIVFTSIIQSIIFQHIPGSCEHSSTSPCAMFYYLPSDQKEFFAKLLRLGVRCRSDEEIKFRRNIRLSAHITAYKQLFMLFFAFFVRCLHKQQEKCIKNKTHQTDFCLHAQQLPFSLRRLKSMHPDMWWPGLRNKKMKRLAFMRRHCLSHNIKNSRSNPSNYVKVASQDVSHSSRMFVTNRLSMHCWEL